MYVCMYATPCILNFGGQGGALKICGIAFMGAHGCQNLQSLYSNTIVGKSRAEEAPRYREGFFSATRGSITTKARAPRINGIIY